MPKSFWITKAGSTTKHVYWQYMKCDLVVKKMSEWWACWWVWATLWPWQHSGGEDSSAPWNWSYVSYSARWNPEEVEPFQSLYDYQIWPPEELGFWSALVISKQSNVLDIWKLLKRQKSAKSAEFQWGCKDLENSGEHSFGLGLFSCGNFNLPWELSGPVV